MKALVTGATGLVGNNVVRLLLERGDTVRVLARAQSDPRPLADLPLEIVRGDLRDPESLAAALAGVDLVVHAAAHVHIGWTGWEIARAVNVEGTRALARACRQAGCRLVHVSSIDALGLTPGGVSDEETPPTNGVLCPYVVTKREAEQAIQEEVAAGLSAVLVNPGYVVGPWDWKPSSGRMLLQVAKGWALCAPLGSNCFCDVRDVAAGILSAAARGAAGRRYILAGDTLSYFQAWRVFARVTGATPPVLPLGPLMRRAVGLAGDLVTRLTGREPDINSAALAIAGQQRAFSSARAAAELGYRGRPLEEAATAAWIWFQEHGYV